MVVRWQWRRVVVVAAMMLVLVVTLVTVLLSASPGHTPHLRVRGAQHVQYRGYRDCAPASQVGNIFIFILNIFVAEMHHSHSCI